MDDRKTHSPGVQLLWATATGLVVSFIGIGYAALYAPEMGRRAADAIDSAERTGTAAAASSSASDISVSVSVPSNIAFTGGAESAETAETNATAIHDRRRDPAVSMAAAPATRSAVTSSVPAVEESSVPIPVTVPPASARADAQGRDPKLPDSTSILPLPPEATAARPAMNDNAQLDSRETRSARGISADASGSQSGGSGQSSNSATGPGGTAASGGSTSNSSGATSSGSGANTGTGSGQSNSGTSGGTQSAGNQGAGAQGGTAGAAGNAASGAANAVAGAAGGALGAVDHAAGGVLGGGGGGLLGKK